MRNIWKKLGWLSGTVSQEEMGYNGKVFVESGLDATYLGLFPIEIYHREPLGLLTAAVHRER